MHAASFTVRSELLPHRSGGILHLFELFMFCFIVLNGKMYNFWGRTAGLQM